eukprot:GEZU01015024.1.p1 GENE.GEZU01015024.1~~GEZU01015024.1.p1  ORF type:complete len:333 (-),score=61.34 GEZU01015024.1:473-1471(-)
MMYNGGKRQGEEEAQQQEEQQMKRNSLQLEGEKEGEGYHHSTTRSSSSFFIEAGGQEDDDHAGACAPHNNTATTRVTTSSQDLPDEIFLIIFGYLSFHCVNRFSLFSRRFHSLVRNHIPSRITLRNRVAVLRVTTTTATTTAETVTATTSVVGKRLPKTNAITFNNFPDALDDALIQNNILATWPNSIEKIELYYCRQFPRSGFAPFSSSLKWLLIKGPDVSLDAQSIELTLKSCTRLEHLTLSIARTERTYPLISSASLRTLKLYNNAWRGATTNELLLSKCTSLTSLSVFYSFSEASFKSLTAGKFMNGTTSHQSSCTHPCTHAHTHTRT